MNHGGFMPAPPSSLLPIFSAVSKPLPNNTDIIIAPMVNDFSLAPVLIEHLAETLGRALTSAADKLEPAISIVRAGMLVRHAETERLRIQAQQGHSGMPGSLVEDVVKTLEEAGLQAGLAKGVFQPGNEKINRKEVLTCLIPILEAVPAADPSIRPSAESITEVLKDRLRAVDLAVQQEAAMAKKSAKAKSGP